MKKIIIALFVVTASITLFACALDTTITTQAIEFESNSQVFALEALSASSLLDVDTTSTLSLSKNTATEDLDEPIVSTEIDEIGEYLQMIESLLGNDQLLNTSSTVSDLEGYAFKVDYSTIDLLGEQTVYSLYYNEVVLETPVEETDDGTTETTTTTLAMSGKQEKDFFFEDTQDDDYVTAYIEGILIAGEVTYNIEGKQISFDSGTVMRLYSYTDKDNFVRVEYKTEDFTEDEKFFFQVVKDGITISESKIKIEMEEDLINVHLELINETTSLTLHFKQEVEEDITIIKIQYTYVVDDETTDSGNIRIYKSIDPETGEAIYDYKVLSDHQKQTFEYQTRTRVYGGKDADSTTDDASL